MSWWEDVLDFGKDVLYDTVVGADGKEKSTLSDLGLLLSLGGGYLLGDSDMAKPDITPTGYQGKVKEYTAVRDRVPMQPDPNRRPGEGGRRYFSDLQYAARPATTPPTVEEARAASQAQAAALAQGNAQNFRRGGLARLFNDPTRREAIQSRFDRLQASRDARRARLDARRAGLGGMFNQKMPAQPAIQVPDIRPPRDFMPPTLEPNPVEANNPFGLPTKMTREMMEEAIPIRPLSGNPGGILSQVPQAPQRPTAGNGVASLMGFAQGGYLKGATDGMADEVPATIDGRQEARLSDGEFVIPADVVSHLGNGNSEAGAKVLEQMMSRVRKERTGNAKQGKQINPEKMTPK